MCHATPNATTDVAPPSVDEPQLLIAAEVAIRLRVHVATVYRLAKSGRLPVHRFGAGEVRQRGLRIPESAVIALLNESNGAAA